MPAVMGQAQPPAPAAIGTMQAAVLQAAQVLQVMGQAQGSVVAGASGGSVAESAELDHGSTVAEMRALQEAIGALPQEAAVAAVDEKLEMLGHMVKEVQHWVRKQPCPECEKREAMLDTSTRMTMEAKDELLY